MTDKFSIDTTLKGGVDEVIEAVTDALKVEGFGVLTRIDVNKVLKTKIDVDFRPYVILGACNPILAHKALNARPDVGLHGRLRSGSCADRRRSRNARRVR